MKYLNLFEEFNFDIESLDINGNNLEVIINNQDLSFKVIDGEVEFSSDDDYERAFELGIELDDELKSYIVDEFKTMCNKTRMRRFGFFKESIRDQYSKMGVSTYYKKHKNDYINPHESRVQSCLNWTIDKIDIGIFLDLACGNGEVSGYLKNKGYTNFKGCDPYFMEIFKNKFNTECYDLRFEDISKNSLPEKFDTIICSYAIHLCNKTYFNNLLWNLSINCKNLVIISPSKYPIIEKYFTLMDSTIIDRTHCKIYKSKYEDVNESLTIDNRKKFISETIDSEVEKSKKFGLDIDKEDIEYEKEIVTTIILKIWDTIKTCSSNEYTQLMTSTINELSNNLNKQMLYYREKTKTEDVKNMYQVHISSIIYSLFMKIDNNLF